MEIDEERFMQLCKEAIAARDRDSLARIIRDINRILYEKEMRLDDLRTNEQIVAGRNWDARFQGTGLPEARRTKGAIRLTRSGAKLFQFRTCYVVGNAIPLLARCAGRAETEEWRGKRSS